MYIVNYVLPADHDVKRCILPGPQRELFHLLRILSSGSFCRPECFYTISNISERRYNMRTRSQL